MADELLDYYERELIYLRRLGAAFGERYPKVAARLQLESGKCDDPHVERLLEGVAFLAARIHLRLDDDFPEITEALLNVVYPHALRPLPSLAMVELGLDPEAGGITTGLAVPRETPLHTRPVRGVTCRFRTCYDVMLWPLAVAAAGWLSPDQLRPAVRAPATGAVVRLLLRCHGDVTFAKLDLERLRLHLAGEPGLVYALYELLGSRCHRIVIREPGEGPGRRSVELPASALIPVGFAPDEGLLPFPRRSFAGYQQLLEYFAFPEKYLFFDLSGLGALREAGFGAEAEVLFLLAPFERAERRSTLATGVTAQTFRLGCTPAVNLFARTSEPVLLTHRQPEYAIVPDARQRNVEAFSIEEVVGVTPGAAEPLRFEPFYAHRHGTERGAGRGGAAGAPLFWTARRRATPWRHDGGTELMLTFVDRAARFARPDLDAVTVRLLCHNGDLPSRLPFGADATDFELPTGGPVRRIVALTKPTPVVQPSTGHGRLWRLVSQLSLNYLSLVDDGLPTLRELLRLHNLADLPAVERQIQGLVGLRTGPTFARVAAAEGLAFARGTRVELELDEDQFVGAGAFLFAAVLERFFALYASMNSFTQVAVRTRQRQERLHEWAPRAGTRVLV